MNDTDTRYLELLEKELTPAIGCTEPIAIALACSRAAVELPVDDEITAIELELSSNVIKNAMGVGIPGTDHVGIPIAAALGAFGGDHTKELQVLSCVNEEHIAQAVRFADRKLVSVRRSQEEDKLFVHATLISELHRCTVTIRKDHRNITEVLMDGEVLYQADAPVETLELEEIPETKVCEIYDFAEQVAFEEISFLLEGADMNRRIANEGLLKDYGLRVGRTIRQNIDRKILSDDMESFAVQLASAAADARMAGCMMPVMTNSGSGNQGITVILPVAAVAEKIGADDEQLARALALSNLIAIHIKKGIGRLSALCGATTAAIGAGCGIARLLGGDLQAVYAVINNMIGDLTGMICDGAKNSCSLKVATSVETAFRSALLALNAIGVTGKQGIIEDDIEKSIRNLVALSTKGMEETDRMILDIMVAKS